MLDMIANEMGLQVFITSHSYFVIKKLYLTALKREGLVSCISLNKGEMAQICDLHDGMRGILSLTLLFAYMNRRDSCIQYHK